ASRTLAEASEQPGFPGLTASILRMIVARLSGNERLSLAMAERVIAGINEISDAELRDLSRPLQTGINQTAITLMHAGKFRDVIELLDRMEGYDSLLEPHGRAHATALRAWAHAWAGEMEQARIYSLRCEQLVVPV